MAHAYTPYPESGLLILGVIHRDKEGERLLPDWLERWRPGVITLELSPYGRDFRIRNGEALRARVRDVVDGLAAEGRPVSDESLAALLSYIDLPAEFTVASEYATSHEVPLFLIDMDRFSSMKLKEIDKLLAKENLVKLLAHGPSRGGQYERTMARLFFQKGVRVFPYTEEMFVRDAYMRDEIARLMSSYGNTRFLHVCGWQHLYDPHHVYQELNPTKVFIYDKTVCL